MRLAVEAIEMCGKETTTFVIPHERLDFEMKEWRTYDRHD